MLEDMCVAVAELATVHFQVVYIQYNFLPLYKNAYVAMKY